MYVLLNKHQLHHRAASRKKNHDSKLSCRDMQVSLRMLGTVDRTQPMNLEQRCRCCSLHTTGTF